MTPAPAPAVAGSPRPALLPRTVLVVEDESLIRSTIVAALEDAAYGVLEASSAEEGLDILRARAVGALFTDIRLPGRMDGWDLAEAARLVHPNLAVIYATGYTAERPRLVPGSVFVRKPYLPSTIIATIDRLLQGGL